MRYNKIILSLFILMTCIFGPSLNGQTSKESQNQSVYFNPETGEIISSNPQKNTGTEFSPPKILKFDPETGLLIENEVKDEPEVEVEDKDKIKAKINKDTYTKTIENAQLDAKMMHRGLLHVGIGITGLSIFPFGILATTLYVEANPGNMENLFANRFYADYKLQQRSLYTKNFKEKRKQLRRKTVYFTQLVSVGLVVMTFAGL